ncbi:protein kinase [Aureococcus anophagefferens]|nr:protein kinase [Aureococcus anophagefferens]
MRDAPLDESFTEFLDVAPARDAPLNGSFLDLDYTTTRVTPPPPARSLEADAPPPPSPRPAAPMDQSSRSTSSMDQSLNPTSVLWEIQPDALEMTVELGRGSFGTFFGYVTKPTLALVVEMMEGGTIEEHVPRKKPGARLCLRFCRDMASAVEYLHERRPEPILHRDLKPPNFLLSAARRVKLGDFGIARLHAHVGDGEVGAGAYGAGAALEKFDAVFDEARGIAETAPAKPMRRTTSWDMLKHALANPPDDGVGGSTKSVADEFDATLGGLTGNCGTVRFMAPEVASPAGESRRYGAAADIFSLALCFYFVWERVPPHVDGSVDGATDAATYLEALRGGARPAFRRTPGAVRDLVAAMWALDPRDRPSARDLGAALDAVRVSSPFGCVSRAPASGR